MYSSWISIVEEEIVLSSLTSAISSVASAAEKLLVLLRDGRKLLGILRSFDQFGDGIFICLFGF